MEVDYISIKDYTELFEKNPKDFSFYHNPYWFLNLARAPILLVCYQDDQVLAVWPFDILKRFKFVKCLSQPPFCSNLGPVFFKNDRIEDSKELSRNKYVKNVIRAFLEKIFDAGFPLISQNLSPKLRQHSAFVEKGIGLSYRHTYTLPNTRDIEDIWTGMSSKHRSKINKLSEKYVLTEEFRAEESIELLYAMFKRQGIKINFSKAQILNAMEQTLSRSHSWVTSMINDSDELVGFGFFGIDDKTLFYNIGMQDVSQDNTTLSPLIIWEGIKKSRTLGKDFDFEGSMIPDLDSLYSNFGAAQSPYYQMVHFKHSWMKALSLLVRR